MDNFHNFDHLKLNFFNCIYIDWLNMKKWKLNSWKNYPAKHIPEYKDQKELMVLKKIQDLLCFCW